MKVRCAGSAPPPALRGRFPHPAAGGLLLAALTFGALAGCDRGASSEPRGEEPLLVMAAASLNRAMPALIDRFEVDTGVAVDLSLGATGNLAAQMESGAPADLFFSADRVTVERLAASGTIRPESVRDYAAGELVLVVREGIAPPASLAQLTAPRFEVVAIANPETAPYGAAALQTLRNAGVRDALSSRIVQGENIAQTYQLVRTGNADAALVARSVVEPSAGPNLPVDPAIHDPILHAAGVLADGNLAQASRFLDFVLSVEGQEILAEHGFSRPPGLR